MGIFGLVVFAAIIVLFAQRNFEFYKRVSNSQQKAVASSAFASVVGILIIGLFDYPWYNYRVFFAFWIALALATAALRVGVREAKRESMANISSADNASIDI